MFMSVKLLKHNSVLNMPFELHTGNRKLNYTTEYEYGNFYKVGNMVTFVLMWKGKITESGEMSFVRIPLLEQNLPLLNTSISVSEFTECLEWKPSTAYGQIINNGLIGIYVGEGGSIGNWKTNSGTDQYLKISGTYISK